MLLIMHGVGSYPEFEYCSPAAELGCNIEILQF